MQPGLESRPWTYWTRSKLSSSVEFLISTFNVYFNGWIRLQLGNHTECVPKFNIKSSLPARSFTEMYFKSILCRKKTPFSCWMYFPCMTLFKIWCTAIIWTCPFPCGLPLRPTFHCIKNQYTNFNAIFSKCDFLEYFCPSWDSTKISFSIFRPKVPFVYQVIYTLIHLDICK